MNPNITFPARLPSPKNDRAFGLHSSEEKWEVALAEERRRLQEDHDALRARESNLREYEARLRVLQETIDQARSAVGGSGRTAFPLAHVEPKTPIEQDAALQFAWGKLHRARELLAAEQNHLRDERMVAQGQVKDLERRERNVAAREQAVVERERLVMEAMHGISVAQPVVSEETMSAVSRFTRVPFEMARSVFSTKKT